MKLVIHYGDAMTPSSVILDGVKYEGPATFEVATSTLDDHRVVSIDLPDVQATPLGELRPDPDNDGYSKITQRENQR